MAKNKKKLTRLTPEDQLKYEIAEELGLLDQVIDKGWKSLSAKETGRIGGMMAKRKKAMKESALKKEN
ncbi:MAG: small, acid-soluble spore protein, alpha/beta type [Lachnospiraceae bacterium]|nr:small, acid-soluble spore protein, alpha/beta type [Lachnospiraceae bacterium]